MLSFISTELTKTRREKWSTHADNRSGFSSEALFKQNQQLPKEKNNPQILISDQVFNVKPYLNRINKTKSKKIIHQCL